MNGLESFCRNTKVNIIPKAAKNLIKSGAFLTRKLSETSRSPRRNITDVLHKNGF